MILGKLILGGIIALLAYCETADAGIAIYQPKICDSQLAESISIFDSSVNEENAISRQKAGVSGERMVEESGDRMICRWANCCSRDLGQILLGKGGLGLVLTPCERRPNDHVVGWGLASVFNYDGDFVARRSQFGRRTSDVHYVDVSAQLGARSLVALPESQVGIKDGGQEAKNAHETGVKLLLRSFRDAPLLAQVGVLAIFGFIAYGAIMLGATRLILPERGISVILWRSVLGFGLLMLGMIVVCLILFR